MDEDQVMNQQDDEIEAFMLGDDVILSSDMDHLIFSQEPEDKERLKSILIRAVANDDYGVINTLVNKGYQLDVLNEKNQTITHLAYYNDNHPTITWSRELVFFNGNNYKNFIDNNGLSHLHIACATDHVEVIKNFLDSGEDIHGRFAADYGGDKNGFTPLHFAVAHHKIEVVKLLLKRGADISATDSSGSTPVHVACEVSWDFKKFMNFESLMEHPCWDAELDILKLLIEFNCDLNVRDNNGNTPILKIFKNVHCYGPSKSNGFVVAGGSKNNLAQLLQCRQLQKFKIVFDHDADITAKNHNDENILHLMIEDLTSIRFSRTPMDKTMLDNIYAKVVVLLLKANRGIDINAKNKKGETPIALAVSLMSYDIFKILLDSNADFSSIEIKDHHYFRHTNTLLSEDLIFNLQKIISTLISRGFELTLGENLMIMKYLAHDVDDCDCGLGSENEIFALETGQAICHGSLTHVKRVFMKTLERLDDALKEQLLIFIKLLNEFCQLVPYRLRIDVESHEMLQCNYSPEGYQNLIQQCREDIDIMKLTTLNHGFSLYDILTKSLYISDSSMTCKYSVLLSNAPELFNRSFCDLLILSHSANSIVRMFIESSAYNSYISLLLPFIPVLCHKLILKYLDNEDILRLCEAAILE